MWLVCAAAPVMHVISDGRRCTAVQSLLLLSAADGWQTFGVRAHARCNHHHWRGIPLVSGSTLPPPTQSSTAVGMRPRRRTRATVFKLISPVNADVAVWTTASAYGHFTPAVVGTRGFWRSTTIFWCSSGQFGRCISYIMYPHFAAMKVWKCNIFESKKSNISAYFDRLFFELWVFKWASKCCDWTFIWMANST